MSPSEDKPALRPPTPLHIDRAAGPTIDLTKTEYSVSIGGSKDAVGTVLLGSPAGLDALTAFLHMALVSGGLLAAPLAAEAQQVRKVWRRVNRERKLLPGRNALR